MKIELEKEGLKRLGIVVCVVTSYVLSVKLMYSWEPFLLGALVGALLITAVLGYATFTAALVVCWVLKGFNIKTSLSHWFK